MKVSVLGALFLVCLGAACGIKLKPGSSAVPDTGVSKTDSRNIVGFNKIKAQNAIDLTVSVTGGYSIIVKADENVVALVTTELEGDTLVVSLKNNTDIKSKVNVSVTLPELDALELIGATHATVTGVKADSFKVDATGASSAEIAGQVKDLKIKAVGSSNINAENLKAESADADAVGASRVIVSAADELKAEATGASNVTYVGEPKSIKQNATDVSSINKK